MREGIAEGAAVFRRRHLRGVLCALTGAGLWGFSGACAQFLLANYDITPSFITAVRMLGAGAVFLLVLLVRNRAQLAAMLGDRRTLGQLAVFGGVGLFLCQITYTIVIGYTNAGTATVLQTTGIAFVMLFTCVLTRRMPRGREVTGLAAAVIATWLIATQGDPSAVYFSGVALGEPLALPALDAAGAAVFAAFVLVGTFAAFALYLHGVSVVGSVQGSLLGAVEPVSATLFATLWLGTAFTGADLAGCALMIAMIFLVTGEKPNVRQDGAQAVEESHSAKS